MPFIVFWFRKISQGEIDQMPDAFAVRQDKDIEAALAGLNAFSESYQTAVDQPQPLFRRRA